MMHIGTPPAEEINGNLIALNTLAGIPLNTIKGFHTPFLNFSANTLQILKASEFTYDSASGGADLGQ